MVVHDYFTQTGGAERVALAIARALIPDLVLTAAFQPAGTYPEVAELPIRTLGIHRVPLVRRDPRLAMPLLGRSFRRAVLPPSDLVVCSSSGWAHHVRCEGPKIVYCHNPPRWLYQPEDYLPNRVGSYGGHRALRALLERHDRRAAADATMYIANSRAVAERIKQAYGLHAVVINPPVTMSPYDPVQPFDGIEPGFFLTIARPRNYKRVSVVRDAMHRLPGARLVVVGGTPGGPRSGRITHIPKVSDAELAWLYQNARALVSVASEDFGLTPVEANLFGTPAVVLRNGGFLDSVVEGVNGCFVDSPDAQALAGVLEALPEFDPDVVRNHAERFSTDNFQRELLAACETALSKGRATVA